MELQESPILIVIVVPKNAHEQFFSDLDNLDPFKYFVQLSQLVMSPYITNYITCITILPVTDANGSEIEQFPYSNSYQKSHIRHWKIALDIRCLNSELTQCLRRFTCLAFSCLVNKTKFNCFRPGRFAFVLD